MVCSVYLECNFHVHLFCRFVFFMNVELMIEWVALHLPLNMNGSCVVVECFIL